jgi:hypothetical protein
MPPRDEKIPLDVLRRIMPKVELPVIPRDPTLLEELTGSFYTEQARTAKDVSARIKDDGKRR